MKNPSHDSPHEKTHLIGDNAQANVLDKYRRPSQYFQPHYSYHSSEARRCNIIKLSIVFLLLMSLGPILVGVSYRIDAKQENEENALSKSSISRHENPIITNTAHIKSMSKDKRDRYAFKQLQELEPLQSQSSTSNQNPLQHSFGENGAYSQTSVLFLRHCEVALFTEFMDSDSKHKHKSSKDAIHYYYEDSCGYTGWKRSQYLSTLFHTSQKKDIKLDDTGGWPMPVAIYILDSSGVQNIDTNNRNTASATLDRSHRMMKHKKDSSTDRIVFPKAAAQTIYPLLHRDGEESRTETNTTTESASSTVTQTMSYTTFDSISSLSDELFTQISNGSRINALSLVVFADVSEMLPLALALGCGPTNCGSPMNEYNSQDFDTVWELTFIFGPDSNRIHGDGAELNYDNKIATVINVDPDEKMKSPFKQTTHHHKIPNMWQVFLSRVTKHFDPLAYLYATGEFPQH